MSLIYGNNFIKKINKYIRRGFKVTLSSTKYNSKPIIKTISNINAYVVKIVIIYYINNFISILSELPYLSIEQNYDILYLRNILKKLIFYV